MPDEPQGPGMPFITYEGPNNTERHYFIQPQNTLYISGELHPDHMDDPDMRNVKIVFLNGNVLEFFGKAGA